MTVAIRTWTALTLAITLVACASVRVRSDFDREVDFSRYRSFDWAEPPVVEPADSATVVSNPFATNSLLDRRIRGAVERELRARGLRKATGPVSDFSVRYHVILKPKVQVTSFPRGLHGRGRFGHSSVRLHELHEGTLIIDLIDTERGELVWRGWGIGRTENETYDEEGVRLVVRRILEKFPS